MIEFFEMGLKFKPIVVKKEISIADLHGKVLAVDSMNILYQFLTTIRQADGSALTNSKGEVTSHLIGLFNRTTSLMEEGVKLVFVFDGKAPELKEITRQKRKAIKEEASLLLKQAEEAGDVEGMRKYASRTVRLTSEMIEDAKKLVGLLGLPVVQAPSEGEAQTAYMSARGDVYAAVSQDYDNLIFGCSLLVKNLSIAGRKKRAGKFAYDTIKPEILSLEENLSELGLDRDQLIVLAILVGTDYNPAGIKGIGPKKGLKLLEKFDHDFDAVFAEVNWEESYPEVSWKEIFSVIKDMPVTDEYSLDWGDVDVDGLYSFLIEEKEFSEGRVKSKVGKLLEKLKKGKQKGLGEFF